jgi:pimeloyl-ACP methyl ester carboxylesterase
MPTVDLPLGALEYRVFGPDDPDAATAVFVHGFLVNGHLWDAVAERLARDGIRSIVPDWPLGAHRLPAAADADLSPEGVAESVLALLDALDLRDVTLVGSDTGGAICQLALRGDHERIGRLVLTNCDAFEDFPPKFFVPLFVAARLRAAVWAVLQTTRPRFLRHSPLAFGLLLSTPRDAALTRRWVQPAMDDAAIRHDITRFAKGVRRDELLDAAGWLADFDKPATLVWGTRDRLFTRKMATRLQAAFPKADLIDVPDATTFVSVDRPDAVADAIRDRR